MSAHDEADLPVWQREDIFPRKPAGAPYGVILGKGQAATFQAFEDLAAHLEKWREPGPLIWSPEREQCFPPEEEPRLCQVLRRRKTAQAEADWASSRFRAFLSSLPVVYFLWAAAAAGQVHRSQGLGMMAVIWLMFFGIPTYEAWKRKRRAARLTAENLSHEAEEVRFEIWLRRQHIPGAKLILGGLAGVYLVQVLQGLAMSGGLLQSLWFPMERWDEQPSLAGLAAAGLVKTHASIGYFNGEWWRLLTSPMLHGNAIHLVMNGLGLLYLGRRTEVMAGWPQLALVFLFSMIGGGVASAYGLPDKSSVGASGGIMGLLGFLFIFERLHGRLVPKRSTRRLLAALTFTFVIGFVGYKFIDNWAHAGGLIAGMVYAAIVFPPSSSPHRPRASQSDRVLGAFAGLVIVAGAVLAIVRIRGF